MMEDTEPIAVEKYLYQAVQDIVCDIDEFEVNHGDPECRGKRGRCKQFPYAIFCPIYGFRVGFYRTYGHLKLKGKNEEGNR